MAATYVKQLEETTQDSNIGYYKTIIGSHTGNTAYSLIYSMTSKRNELKKTDKLTSRAQEIR